MTEQSSPPDEADPRPPNHYEPAMRRFGPLRRVRYGAALGALCFWWLALSPTLLPRAWTVQAAVAAVCASIGYLVGRGLHRLAHLGLQRAERPLTARSRRIAWRVLAGLSVLVVVIGAVQWVASQNDQRDVIGMPHISLGSAVAMVVLSLLLLALLVSIGRGVVWIVRRISSSMERLVPGRLASTATTVAVLVLLLAAASWAGNTFVGWADTNFGALDGTTADGVEEPVDNPFVSGGQDSLVPWDTLGLQGRTFTGGASDLDGLQEFAGAGATVLPPIRVYAGLNSADSEAERAELAVAELERTGAFDRAVLMVASVTGTGWVNPDAARTLEHMYGGDTAIVGMQYSFLPSWIAFLVGVEGAGSTAEALFDAVHERWSQLPPDDRPTLLVYGESLGSFGAETAFAQGDIDASIDAMLSRADGVLYVGPTAGNPIFQQLVDARRPGTPTWKPELEGRQDVRVVNQVGQVPADDTTWESPRLLYLFHPTDAVGTWQWSHLWSPPGWVESPQGYGVPTSVRWLPVITWVQETADLMAGFSALPGFGHDYRLEFVDSWAALAPPDGWTSADSARLSAFLGLD